MLATDYDTWLGKTWGSKRGFELARRALNSHVDDMTIDVLDLSPERTGVFDLVLFLGVLYHLRHPLLTLERIFSATARQLVLETHVDMVWNPRPAMVFYPNAELHNDPSNWWGPNPAAVIAMLKSVGFNRVKLVSQLRYIRLGCPLEFRLSLSTTTSFWAHWSQHSGSCQLLQQV